MSSTDVNSNFAIKKPFDKLSFFYLGRYFSIVSASDTSLTDGRKIPDVLMYCKQFTMPLRAALAWH